MEINGIYFSIIVPQFVEAREFLAFFSFLWEGPIRAGFPITGSCRVMKGRKPGSGVVIPGGLWYNIRVEREYIGVSLTGPKLRPVFG